MFRRSALLASLTLLVVLVTCDRRAPLAPTESVAPPAAGLVATLPATLCGTGTTVDLLAGRTERVGTVTVRNSESAVYVTYHTEDGWPLRRTALFVGQDVSDIPTNGSGNPLPGHFPRSASHPDGTFDVTWEVSMALSPGEPLVVAAYAQVGPDDAPAGAWGAGTRINEKGNWATYFTATVEACGPVAVVSTPDEGATVQAGQPLAFDGSESLDPAGGGLSYDWDFGDGEEGGSAQLAHVFAEPGSYAVDLEVTDMDGATDQTEVDVQVAPPPVPTGTTTLHGEVLDPSGDPLPGATISRVGGATLGTTDADGQVEIADFPTGITVVLKATLDGYSDDLVRVTVPGGTSDASFSSTLRPRNAPQTLADAAAGGTVSGEDGVAITFPANALVDGDGNPVTGAVNVAMTPIDVSGDELGSFPGGFTGIGPDGSSGLILSYGTAEFLVTQGGQKLQLAPGKTATIDLPIYTSGASAGDHIPLWSLDEATGLWIQEGEGTVMDGGPTGLFMRAEIGHLSWWNCDFLGDVIEGYFGCYTKTPEGAIDYTQCYLETRTEDDGPGWLGRADLPAEDVLAGVPAGRTLQLSARAFTPDCVATGSRTEQIPTSDLTNPIDVEVKCVTTGGPQRIAYGDKVDGSIDTGGSADAYVFAGASGDEARVDLTSTGLDGAYEIRDPSGTLLASGTFGDETVFLDLTTTGDYDIVVSGALSNSTGTYHLELSKLVQPPTVTITPPTSLTGTIEFPHEVDTYAFNGATDDEISVAAVQDASQLAGVWTLRSPSDAVIATESFGATEGARALQLPENGTYTLEVAATGGVPGAYDLAVNDAPATELTYGSSLSGSIDVALQVDAYRFTAASGDVLRFDLTRSSTFDDTHMRVFSPSGDQVLDAVFPVNSADQHPFLTVSEAGEYRVSVYSVDGRAVGAYGIALEQYVAQGPMAMAIGDAVSGEIGFPPQVDSWNFAGTAGQQVVLDVGASTGSALEGTMQLLDPSSGVVVSGSFGTAGSYSELATLPADGTYTIEVAGTDGIPGSYDLSLTEAPSSGPGALTPGDLVEGSIDAVGQVDEYTFDAMSGDAVRVYAGPQANSSIDGYVTLLDPSGATIFHRRYTSAYSVDRVEDLSTTGTYTIQVDGTFSLGGYRLGLGTGSGRLDTSFGTNGAVQGPQGTDYIRQITELPGGQILVLTDTELRRYDASGTADALFGTNGVVDVATLLGGVTPTYMAVQPDGAILVCAPRPSSPRGWVIGRLAADGSGLDTGFGTSGIVTVPFPYAATPRAIVFVPDGSSTDLLVVGSGTATSSIPPYLTLARLNSDGSLDANFASGTNPLVTGIELDPAAAALQSTGQVVVAGTRGGAARVYRFNADGTQDTSFGVGGEASLDNNGLTLGMAIRANDAVVLTGDASRASGMDMAVMQFTADGAPDPSFGSGGMSFVDYGHDERGNGVTIDADGNVLVAGTCTLVPDGGEELMVVRLDPAGALDGLLGVGGVVVESSPNDGRSILVDSSGRILVGGRYLAGSGPYITNFALLRLLQ